MQPHKALKGTPFREVRRRSANLSHRSSSHVLHLYRRMKKTTRYEYTSISDVCVVLSRRMRYEGTAAVVYAGGCATYANIWYCRRYTGRADAVQYVRTYAYARRQGGFDAPPIGERRISPSCMHVHLHLLPRTGEADSCNGQRPTTANRKISYRRCITV